MSYFKLTEEEKKRWRKQMICCIVSSNVLNNSPNVIMLELNTLRILKSLKHHAEKAEHYELVEGVMDMIKNKDFKIRTYGM